TSWNASTTTAVRNMGWRIIPIYVDLQAPCFSDSHAPKIPSDINDAFTEGANAANGAVGVMQALGIGYAGAPGYLGIEGYPADRNGAGTCTASVRAFVGGWVSRLHALNYVAGVYSSLSAAIADLAAGVGISAMPLPDMIWFASWQCPGSPSTLY